MQRLTTNSHLFKLTNRLVHPVRVISSTSSYFSTINSDMPNSEKHVVRLNDIPQSDLKNKTVFVRVDYNVTMIPEGEGFKVKESSYKRILESFPTLRYLVEGGAKVVIASHLGDPEGDLAPFCLGPAARVVEKELDVRCSFVDACIGEKVKSAVSDLTPGTILLLDNLRFHKGEKKNLPEFVSALADAINPDIYVNDAFGTAHRAHASVVGLPLYMKEKKNIPCVSGFLMSKEVTYLSEAIPKARSSDFSCIFGGAKVTSKLPIFNNLVPMATELFVGSAMALPFLKAQGANVTYTDEDNINAAKLVLQTAKEYDTQIILPVDFLTSKTFEDPEITGEQPVVYDVEHLPAGVFCLDIGPKTIELFKQKLASKKTVVWNGPVGKFEWKPYAQGSISLVHILSNQPETISIAGGGETTQVIKLVKGHKITHVSTGGGASLEMLEGKDLPAIKVLDRV